MLLSVHHTTGLGTVVHRRQAEEKECVLSNIGLILGGRSDRIVFCVGSSYQPTAKTNDAKPSDRLPEIRVFSRGLIGVEMAKELPDGPRICKWEPT